MKSQISKYLLIESGLRVEEAINIPRDEIKMITGQNM